MLVLHLSEGRRKANQLVRFNKTQTGDDVVERLGSVSNCRAFSSCMGIPVGDMCRALKYNHTHLFRGSFEDFSIDIWAQLRSTCCRRAHQSTCALWILHKESRAVEDSLADLELAHDTWRAFEPMR